MANAADKVDTIFSFIMVCIMIVLCFIMSYKERNKDSKKIVDIYFPNIFRHKVSYAWKLYTIFITLFVGLASFSAGGNFLINTVCIILSMYFAYRFCCFQIDNKQIFITALDNYLILFSISNVILFVTIICISIVSTDLRTKIIFKICILPLFILSAILFYTTIKNILTLILNDSKLYEYVEKYFSYKSNRYKSIKNMRLELIITQFLVLIWNLSAMVYLSSLLGQKYIGKGNEINSIFESVYYTIIVFSAGGFCDYAPTTLVSRVLTIVISCTGLIFTACFISILLGKKERELEKIKKKCVNI